MCLINLIKTERTDLSALRQGWFIVYSLFFVLSFPGCASLGTYNPATGRSEMIFINTSEEVSMGKGLHQQLTKQFKLSRQESKTRRVERVGRKIAAVSDRRDYEYHFFLVEKEEINAFTTPGGYIYMFSGLLDKLTSDDQVAFVLAHEVGHCAARHTVKKFQAALGYDLIGGLVLSRVESEQARQLASMSSDVLTRLVFSAYGRGDEFEADRLGVKYLNLAGYDPGASVTALEVLQKESRDAGAPLVLRSHPHIPDRIKAVRDAVKLLNSR